MDDATRPRLKRDTETETLTLIQKIQKLMKKITVQFVVNEQGVVDFINPICDEMPALTFVKMVGILNEMATSYNSKVEQAKTGGE